MFADTLSLPSSGPTRNLQGCESARCTTGHRSSSCDLDMPLAAKRYKHLQSQFQASDRAYTSNTDSPAKRRQQLCTTSKDGAKCEPDVHGDVMQQDKEAGAAFEVPSQMPRELRWWAWDKCGMLSAATHYAYSLFPFFLSSGCPPVSSKPCVSVRRE